MRYQYTFVKVDTKNLFMQVKYSSQGQEDILKNFDLTNAEFTPEGLEAVAESYAPLVIARWNASNAAPESLTPAAPVKEVEYVAPVVKQTVDEAPPAFDPFTQKLESVTEETATHIYYKSVVVDLNAQEQVDFLASWRATASVTPRQARLELAKRGLLANIDTIIAALPADQQDAVKIEWEYAVSVERKSAWVVQLGMALGLDDAGLDGLFRDAAQL